MRVPYKNIRKKWVDTLLSMEPHSTKFIRGKTAEWFLKQVDSILGSSTTSQQGWAKDWIRFRPVGATCQEAREHKGLSIKQIAFQMKVPQYRLTAIEDSHLREVRLGILERYIDFLGVRVWFNTWVKHNKNICASLKARRQGKG